MSACFPGFVSRRTDSPANCNRLTTLCRNMYLSSKLTRSTLAACLCLGLANPAYYLAAKFPGNFEEAVLHAINGGGQNQARAILTGALVGAQVGLTAIPKRSREQLRVDFARPPPGSASGNGLSRLALSYPQHFETQFYNFIPEPHLDKRGYPGSHLTIVLVAPLTSRVRYEC
jgi:hypothetical protein